MAAAQGGEGKGVLGLGWAESQLLTMGVDGAESGILLKVPDKELTMLTRELLIVTRLERQEFRLLKK